MSDQDVYKLVSCQFDLNKLMKSGANRDELSRTFKVFVSLLSNSIYESSVKINHRICEICKASASPSSIALDCGHFICSNSCFEVLVATTIGIITKYDQLKCPKCKEKIPTSVTKAVYGGEQKFRELINSEEFEPRLICAICGMEYPASKFKTYSCSHRYCIECVTLSVNYLISEGNVGDKVACPECNTPLEPQLIFDILDAETKNRYDTFLLRNMAAEPGEKFVECIGKPGINCTYGQVISTDREVYRCPQCETTFCPKCKLEPHPKMSCQEKALLQNSGDPMIQQQIQNGSMQLCPWCNLPIIKDRGCKYMTCPSQDCKGKRYFCWDCRSKLTEKHQEHKCTTEDVISNRIKRFIKGIFGGNKNNH